MAKKNTKQCDSEIFIKFKEESSFNRFIQEMGIGKSEWSNSPFASFAESYHFVRERRQIKFYSASDNITTEQFVQQAVNVVEGDAVIIATTFCLGKESEMWGWYYLGNEVRELHIEGNEVFDFFGHSPENIEEWLGEYKRNLCDKELAILTSVYTPNLGEEFVIENDEILIEYVGNGGVVVIPDNITEISSGAFSNTIDSITAITIPASVKVIENGTFSYAENLETVTLSEGLLKIEDMAFADCPKLKKIVIPKSVVFVGDGAFAFGNTEVIYQNESAMLDENNTSLEFDEDEEAYIKVVCSADLKEVIAQFIVDELIKMHLRGAGISDDSETFEKAKKAWLDNELSQISFTEEGVYVKTTTTDDASFVLVRQICGKNSYFDDFDGTEIESMANEIVKKYPGTEVYAKFEYQGNAYFYISVVKTINGEIVAYNKEC